MVTIFCFLCFVSLQPVFICIVRNAVLVSLPICLSIGIKYVIKYLRYILRVCYSFLHAFIVPNCADSVGLYVAGFSAMTYVRL